MIFVRRDRAGATRWVATRVGLFFLAAGIWVAGAMVGNEWITGAAIAIAAVALLLGLIGRRYEAEDEEMEEV